MNVCKHHGGLSTGRPVINGSRSIVIRPDGSLAAKIEELRVNGDPMDALQPIATLATTLQEYISRYEAGVPLTAQAIDYIASWSESLVRSITRLMTARANQALTAAEILTLQARMADIAKTFVSEDRLEDYFKALKSLSAGQGDNWLPAERRQAALPVLEVEE